MHLLRKKYFFRWKTISWNLGLQRRARERRNRLANSVLGASQRSIVKSSATLDTRFSQALVPQDQSKSASVGSMPPPAVPEKTVKRQSMPSKLIEDGRALLASFNSPSKGQKRKREDSEMGNSQIVPFSKTHRRSSTLAASSSSALPHTLNRSAFRRSIDSTRTGDGSLLGSILKDQAQKIAPYVKSDTTNTDYFRLKAMGMDPDTPAIPRTKPKVKATGCEGTGEAPRMKAIMPAVNGGAGQPLSKTSKTSSEVDDDEALFASIREVRNTLSESTSWFQNERLSMERSMTPQSQASPPRVESAAERRLRELKERGPTPTRAELRYRAMKDTSHLPNGFWDRSPAGSPQQNGGHERNGIDQQSQTPTKVRGFAALTSRNAVNGTTSKQKEREPSYGQGGDSADDAIEL